MNRSVPLFSALLLLAAAICPGRAQERIDSVWWRLEETDRIFGEEPGLSLTSVQDLVQQGDTLYLVDVVPGGSGRVLIMTASGDSLGHIGQAGDGPGEFRSATAVQQFGDTLWVTDGSGARIEGFVNGEPALSIRLPQRDGPARCVPLGLLADGSVMMSYVRSIYEITGGQVISSPLVRVDRAGLVLDTLLISPVMAADFWEVGTQESAGHTPLKQSPLTALSEDGAYLVEVQRPSWDEEGAATFGIKVVDADGTLRFSLAIPYSPIPTDLDRVLDPWRNRLTASALRAMRESLRAFPYLPPATALRLSDTGDIWVRREQVRPDSAAWDVISVPEQRLVARIMTRADLDLILPREREAWGVTRDRFDVPVLLRYAILR